MKLTQIFATDPPAPRIQYRVSLTAEERADLLRLTTTGRSAARTLTHARILLLADAASADGGRTDAVIGDALGVSLSTVWRVRQRCVEQGLDAALHRAPRTEQRLRKLDGTAEAHLIALACSAPPAGRARWTLRLLAERLVELTVVDAVSYETVRRTLKKTT